MKNSLRLTLLVIVTIGLFVAVVGCGAAPSPTIDENAVRAYADPATETTLQGLSEGDLAKYTEYGDAGFKAAVTQAILDPVTAQINNQLGTYVSITFLSVEQTDEYVVVHYKAKYTKGEVGVRMVFDAEGLVAGQFFE